MSDADSDTRKRILVVDDDPDFLKVIGIRLEANNYEVIAVSSGREALEKVKEVKPDAVFLDVLMPGMDGLQVLDRIRSFNKELPIFIITAFSDEKRFEKAKDLKASGFIVKTADLKREIDNIINILNIAPRYKGGKMSGGNAGSKKKILVIDDEGDLLKVERTRLEVSGYEVLTLSNGERAMQVVKSEKPDLVLLDIVMPGKNGCDICRELKADEATRGIPVIIFTAHYPEEEYIKIGSGEVGADDYMVKPFEPQILLAKIRALIK